MYKIGLFFSRNDFNYRSKEYGNSYNLLFITGMVGSGKSTLANKIAKERSAKLLSLDWLTWSEVYRDNPLAVFVLNEFYQVCPRAKEAADKNWWHQNGMTSKEKHEIKYAFVDFLIDYAFKNNDELFIIEGIDVYKYVPLDSILKTGIIIKRTGAIKCFIRRYKRDKTTENQKSAKAKKEYLKMVLKESRDFYFKDRKKLNALIHSIIISN